MHVVIGATGQTGSAAAATLLASAARVRVVLRDAAKAAAWRARGAEVALVDLNQQEALADAIAGAETLYAMNPPAYGTPDLFAAAHRVHATIVAAAGKAGVGRIVALSSVGAQHVSGTGNIATTNDFERQLAAYGGGVTILRAANFMENFAWSLEPAKVKGVLPSMFLPIERKLPMVSARDVGRNRRRIDVGGRCRASNGRAAWPRGLFTDRCGAGFDAASEQTR